MYQLILVLCMQVQSSLDVPLRNPVGYVVPSNPHIPLVQSIQSLSYQNGIEIHIGHRQQTSDHQTILVYMTLLIVPKFFNVFLQIIKHGTKLHFKVFEVILM